MEVDGWPTDEQDNVIRHLLRETEARPKDKCVIGVDGKILYLV